jgi:hypothetical protein
MDELLKVFIDGKGTFYQRVKLSDNIEKEKETGYLYCKNSILGHIGIQAYNGYEVGITDQKVVYIHRQEQDVFDEASMNSIKGKPVTKNHPEEMVNSKNFKDYVVGFIDDVWRDGDNLVGVIVIQDEEAIKAVESGELKDLSLGYTAKLVKLEDGVLKQENIVINHLAIVANGRAKNARIMDQETVETILEVTEENSDTNNKKNEGETKIKMKTFIDFMNDFKQVNAMPKSEFRDKAYEQLNLECQETLKVSLPSLDVVEIKDSAIENSVGVRDSVEPIDETKKEPKVLKIYAQDEDMYFKKLYRSMDKTENAKKYSSMSYMDVIEMLEGRK